MTPPSKSPWPAPPAVEHALDSSPLAVIERDQVIADGIRRGLIQPGFALAARIAVKEGIKRGLITMPAAASDAPQPILSATSDQPAPGG